MKKITFLISFYLILGSLTACSNDVASIVQPDDNNVQTLSTVSAGNKSDILIKQMVDKRFTFADKNKDKKLVFNEFKGLESEHDDIRKKSFDLEDTNKDGIITYDEFVKAELPGIKSSIKQIFSMMDNNKNGFIDQGEELDTGIYMDQTGAADAGQKITTEEIKKEYIAADLNKDNKLTFEEYLSVEMKYILMASVDPYKNSFNSKVNPVSINRFINNAQKAIKR
ncbi:MAG: EF-hand domain-containing protein [Candidatus Sericytochromatia bacterium]|nr:EF-hand domain-containing protein [Candidatus Sericytochromatia bacterium]